MNLSSSWVEESSISDSLQCITGIALQHAYRSGNPLLQSVLESLDRKVKANESVVDDLTTLIKWEVDYSESRTVYDLHNERQALAMFSKSQWLDLGIDRSSVAMGKFIEAEEKCRETNEALRAWGRGEFSFLPGVDSVFFRAAKSIQRVLGDVPELSELKLRFGPGATTQTKKRFASARTKLGAVPSCSENSIGTVKAVLEELPLYANLLAGLPVDNVDDRALVSVEVKPALLGFVLKNAETFRSVGTEPSLNMMVQLGIGDFMSERLLAFGIDLKDQSRNKGLAREGSLTGALATLDLSSASDTISRELIFHLLPVDWACFLDQYRSRSMKLPDGRVIVLEKFSSMGNGFTFPLETLIFWAISKACCDDDETISVYGDDIICPTHRFEMVRRCLQAAGFTLNTAKSYSTGVFRESCGGDFFKGFDIRPYYQKKLVSAATLFALHNLYVRTYQPEMSEYVLQFIHPSLRLYGPDGFGDGHLIGDWSPQPHNRTIGWAGFLFDTFTLRSNKDRRRTTPGDKVLPYYSIYLNESKSSENEIATDRFFRGLGPVVDVKSSGYVFPGSNGYKRISIYTLTGL